MNKFHAFVAVCVVVAGVSAWGQHSDVRPHVQAGRIVTGAFDDSTGTFIEESRVFGYDFGEVIGDPFFAADPGFNASAGSGMPAGSQLRFNLLDNLRYWDGVGEVSFGEPFSAESLKVSLGAQSRTLTGTSDGVEGFALATVGANGNVHLHLNSFLQGSDGNADASDGFPPAAGIYLVAMELTSSDAGVGASLPFFVLFNNGLEESAHDLAMAHVAGSVVPEPGMGLGLAGAAMLVLRRRRGK